MPDSLRNDTLAGLVGFLYASSTLAGRWQVFQPHERSIVAVVCLLYLSISLFSTTGERWYRKCRAPVLLAIKAAVIALPLGGRPFAHFQVRLNAPPTGRPIDYFSALAGLRIAIAAIGGLVQLRCSLWVVQQIVVLYSITNLEHDCRTSLLSHPLMAKQIAGFHKAMVHMTQPVLPQAPLLVPSSELARCKAAVCFWSLLLAFVLPAVVMVRRRPLWPRRPALGNQQSWLSRVEKQIEDLLRALRQWNGLTETPVLWWLMAVTLWAITASAF